MIEELFSIPVYRTQVSNLSAIQNEITNGIKNSKFSTKPEWGRTHYLSNPDFSENWLVKHRCDTLLSEIAKHVDNYKNALEVHTDCAVKESWVALFKENNYGHIHSHSSNIISGVYYYKVKGSEGNLFFKSKRYWQGAAQTKSQEGLLLLFPSDLEHGITTNTSTVSRISISFNLA